MRISRRTLEGTPCPSCEHPVTMHVRRGCIGYVASVDGRCSCDAVSRGEPTLVAGGTAHPPDLGIASATG